MEFQVSGQETDVGHDGCGTRILTWDRRTDAGQDRGGISQIENLSDERTWK